MSGEDRAPQRIGVECAEHGLRYNPQVSSGCVLCARRSKTGQPRLFILSLLTVTLVAAFWYSWTSSAGGATRRQSQAPPPPRPTLDSGLVPVSYVPPRLSPEPYRQTVSELESVLYQLTPAAYGDLQRASQLGLKLEQEIRGRQPSSPAANSRTASLLAWASSIDAAGDVGYAAPNLKPARQQWEQLRSELFEPAGWFQSSSTAVESAQTPAPAKINRATIRALKKVGQDLHHLILTGSAESAGLGEITSEARTPASARVEARWRKWRDHWMRRVDKVAAVFPPNPGLAANPNVLFAYQALGQALHHLRIVTVPVNDFGVPFTYQRQMNFEAAKSRLSEAESYLAKIGF